MAAVFSTGDGSCYGSVPATAMLRLLRTVSFRDYRAAPGRLALMIGGIASGVALVAALGIVNQSVLADFRRTLERAAGRAALQVVLGTGEVGFDEDTVGAVAADRGVAHAFGLVRGTLQAASGPPDMLQLFGIDLGSNAIDFYDVALVDRDGDDLDVLNDTTSVFLTEDYARRRNIAVGARVPFATPAGVRVLRVRGLMRAQGLASVFGGDLAVMDLMAAQRLLGKDHRVDQVDVLVKEGASPKEVQRRLEGVLPPSLSVGPPVLRGERFERVIAAFQSMLDGFTVFCLLAGVFIVYNTTATAITQRARDLAILLTLGAERRGIFALVVAEAVVVGLVASLCGIALGWGLAHLLLTLVVRSMGVVYQVRLTVDSLSFTPGRVALYAAVGTGCAVAAALVPARKASRLDPLELMRPDFRERMAVGSPNGTLVAVATVILALAAAAIRHEWTTRSAAWVNVGLTLWCTGLVVLAIPLMSGITSLLRLILPRLFGIEGRVAVEGLRRSPGRTGVTAAVIAFTLTIAVTIASIARSFRESERNWFILIGDLVVSAVGTEGGWLETPLSADVEPVLGRIPGVAHVETYRAVQGQPFRDARIAMVAVSPGFLDTPQFRRQLASDDADRALRAVAGGRAVIVSDNLADRFGIAVGDGLALPTPSGPREFPVAGIVAADYSGDQGSVIVGRDLFAALWRDRAVTYFNVFLAPGESTAVARQAILDALGRAGYRIKILTVNQALAYHQHMVDEAFTFTWAIQLLAVVVTLAGIFDLLTTQVIERRREIGIFRAVGAEEPRVARAIRLEAVVIGVAGALLGTGLAFATSLVWVHVNFRILLGYILEHHFAVLTAITCVALSAAAAFLAGHLAARPVLRQPVLETLRYE
ncbi:MAG TPA: FtsX-like permease family protein [Candidatus Binatia bacterium]|nr:FtsX-like permease family protein [Candidatus Binatia bacterium]